MISIRLAWRILQTRFQVIICQHQLRSSQTRFAGHSQCVQKSPIHDGRDDDFDRGTTPSPSLLLFAALLSLWEMTKTKVPTHEIYYCLMILVSLASNFSNIYIIPHLIQETWQKVEGSQICYPAGNPTDRHAADVICLRRTPHEIKDTWKYICTTFSNGLYADLMQSTDCSFECILLAVSCVPIEGVSLNYAVKSAIIMNRNQESGLISRRWSW